MEKRTRVRRGGRIGMVLLNSALMLLAIGMTVAVIGGVALSLYLRTRVETKWDEASALPTGAGASQLYYYPIHEKPI